MRAEIEAETQRFVFVETDNLETDGLLMRVCEKKLKAENFK